MSRRIEDLHPDLQPKCRALLEAAAAQGIKLLVVHTLRTYEEQALIYAQGRSRPGAVVTNARPGYSWHNFGRAFDVAFVGDKPGSVAWAGPWDKVGELGEAQGLSWGGRWRRPDRPHMEHSGGMTLAQARAKYEKENPGDATPSA